MGGRLAQGARPRGRGPVGVPHGEGQGAAHPPSARILSPSSSAIESSALRCRTGSNSSRLKARSAAIEHTAAFGTTAVRSMPCARSHSSRPGRGARAAPSRPRPSHAPGPRPSRTGHAAGSVRRGSSRPRRARGDPPAPRSRRRRRNNSGQPPAAAPNHRHRDMQLIPHTRQGARSRMLKVDLTSDQTGSSSVSEGIARGRRTMSEPSKVATMAKGNRSTSRQSATSSGWTP